VFESGKLFKPIPTNTLA